jgi:hypothetical protein
MDSCICSEGIRFLEAPWRATWPYTAGAGHAGSASIVDREGSSLRRRRPRKPRPTGSAEEAEEKGGGCGELLRVASAPPGEISAQYRALSQGLPVGGAKHEIRALFRSGPESRTSARFEQPLVRVAYGRVRAEPRPSLGHGRHERHRPVRCDRVPGFANSRPRRGRPRSGGVQIWRGGMNMGVPRGPARPSTRPILSTESGKEGMPLGARSRRSCMNRLRQAATQAEFE